MNGVNIMNIKSLDGCFLVDYWDIESILEEEFGLPHETHFLYDEFDNSISFLNHKDSIKNDIILLYPYEVKKFTEEQLESDDLWDTVNFYLNGYNEDEYVSYNYEIETLLSFAATFGDFKEGTYYIRISW